MRLFFDAFHRVAIFFLVVSAACGVHAGTLIPMGASWKFARGSSDPSPGDAAAWRQRVFNDAGWERGNAAFVYGEAGYMVLGDKGWKVHDNANKLADERAFRTRGDTEHLQNFLDCVRSRATPNCDIEEGAKSAAMCHLGNASYRVGRTLTVEHADGLVRDSGAAKMLRGSYRAPWTLPVVEKS